MNYRMIAKLVSLCLLIVSLFMLLPIAYALYAREDIMPFVKTIGLAAIFCAPLLLFAKPRSKVLYARDSWFAAGVIWIVISLFGTLPFYFSGVLPSYIDCFFETVSGFTTTSATLLKNIEIVPQSVLMWRSLTNWIGGMGVLVLLLAMLPVAEMDTRSLHLLRAEAPGPGASKLVPKMARTAKILYLLYFVLTMLTFLALRIAKMPAFDALLHSWSIAGTGGFSIKNASIAHYDSTLINIICTVSMLLFSLNFTVFFQIVLRQFKSIFKNSELLFHIGVVLTSIAFISFNIRGMFSNFGLTFEHAAFQVSSIVTTTGLSSYNYDLWPTFTKAVMLVLMLMGGCAGSTAGGIKAIRTIILIKAARREIERLTHPRVVRPVRVSGKSLDDGKVTAALHFFFIYILIIIILTLLLALDGFDFLTTFSAAVATFNNIGPGFGLIGPGGNYEDFSQLSKLVMCLGMLLGRLEIFPVLILFLPSTFKLHGQEITFVAKRMFKGKNS